MIIMPSNDRSPTIEGLRGKYPDRLGLLNTPNCWKNPKPNEIWAFDNGCFSNFNKSKYFYYLELMSNFHNPLFVVCPDVVGCHERTRDLWNIYYPILKNYNIPIAFVAQDGSTPKLIPNECDWIFVGGLDPWKRENVHKFIGVKPVHVGRVNSVGFVRYCESLGVDSVDGTGWVRARERSFNKLKIALGETKQKELF